jgi:hypothetical protein
MADRNDLSADARRPGPACRPERDIDAEGRGSSDRRVGMGIQFERVDPSTRRSPQLVDAFFPTAKW